MSAGCLKGHALKPKGNHQAAEIATGIDITVGFHISHAQQGYQPVNNGDAQQYGENHRREGERYNEECFHTRPDIRSGKSNN